MKEKRVVAFLIDYAVTIAIALIVAAVVTIISTLADKRVGLDIFGFFLPAIIMACFYPSFRDVVQGQSIGKRFMKIKLINKNGKEIHILRIFLYDITVLIWPIEAILLICADKTVGELISGIKVVEAE